MTKELANEHKRASAVLNGNDAGAFLEIRREALVLEPTNFEASIEEDAAINDQEWRARLSGGGTFGVFDAAELIGIATYHPEADTKVAHRGHLSGLYARPKARGTGAAKQLMEFVLAIAGREVTFLYLVVNQSNARAIRFYEKLGFTVFGHDPGGLVVDGTMYEDCLMLVPLQKACVSKSDATS